MKKALFGLIVLSSLSSAFAGHNRNISFPLITTDGEGTYFTETCSEDDKNCRFDHDVQFHCDETSQPYLTLKEPRALFGSKTYNVLIKSIKECHKVETLVAETILSADTTDKPQQHVWISMNLSKVNSSLTRFTVEECLKQNH